MSVTPVFQYVKVQQMGSVHVYAPIKAMLISDGYDEDQRYT